MSKTPTARKGDTVLFHFDAGGLRFVREATVLYVWGEKEIDPALGMLCLEVDFQEEDYETSNPSRLQAHVPCGQVAADAAMPPSGSWTPTTPQN